ncbi:hypothetical protein ACWGCW_04935 [Streptomyces sp. NPDC054933]
MTRSKDGMSSRGRQLLRRVVRDPAEPGSQFQRLAVIGDHHQLADGLARPHGRGGVQQLAHFGELGSDTFVARSHGTEL